MDIIKVIDNDNIIFFKKFFELNPVILYSDEIIEKLIKGNKFDMFKIVFQNFGSKILFKAINYSIKYENIEIFKYIIKDKRDINYIYLNIQELYKKDIFLQIFLDQYFDTFSRYIVFKESDYYFNNMVRLSEGKINNFVKWRKNSGLSILDSDDKIIFKKWIDDKNNIFYLSIVSVILISNVKTEFLKMFLQHENSKNYIYDINEAIIKSGNSYYYELWIKNEKSDNFLYNNLDEHYVSLLDTYMKIKPLACINYIVLNGNDKLFNFFIDEYPEIDNKFIEWRKKTKESIVKNKDLEMFNLFLKDENSIVIPRKISSLELSEKFIELWINDPRCFFISERIVKNNPRLLKLWLKHKMSDKNILNFLNNYLYNYLKNSMLHELEIIIKYKFNLVAPYIVFSERNSIFNLLLKYYKDKDKNKYIEWRIKNKISIIEAKDKKMLKEFILDGYYLPYEDILYNYWIELNYKDKEFVNRYRIPLKYHDQYFRELDENTLFKWNFYIHGEYHIFNRKIRNAEILNKEDEETYNLLSNSIISAPIIKKKCFIYRGIRMENFGYKIGDTIIFDSFGSCSSIKEISEIFKGENCCMFIIEIPKNAVLLDITTIKKSEYEIVLPPQAILEFVGVRESNIILKYKGYQTKYGPYLF